MKRIYILLIACLAIAGCKKNDVSFTYSPESPRAGQTVKFTNYSSTGEEWSWSFGDGSVSTLKSPSHTYKKPGTFDVILKVDNRNNWTATKRITVYDTIPTFVCSDSVFAVYTDYTFTAQVYNPYNDTVKYQWALADTEQKYAVVTDTTLKNSSLHLFFTRALESALVKLTVIKKKDTTEIEQFFDVKDKATNSLLIRTAENDYRQRIFGDRAENYFIDSSAKENLDVETDTVQVYNGYLFSLSELQTVFPELEGFHIANRKIYYRAGGVWVANIDGTNAVVIDSLPCPAMTLDLTDNRIYWANDNGIWYMPFVGSDNNQFIYIPTLLNTLSGVTKLAADPEKK